MPFDFPRSNPFLSAPSSLDPDKRRLSKIMGPVGREVIDDILGYDDLAPTFAERDWDKRSLEFIVSKEELSRERELESIKLSGETAENCYLLLEAKKYFGEENVHGVADVERALGFKIDRRSVPRIPFTVQDFEKTKKVRKARNVDEMLVLTVGFNEEGLPLTGERLTSLFERRYDDEGLGTFLNRNENWYADLPFFVKQPLMFQWLILTKRCLPGTTYRCHSRIPGHSDKQTQGHVINNFANQIQLPPGKIHRAGIITMMYALGIHRLTTKARQCEEVLLLNERHWSDSQDVFNHQFITLGVDRKRGVCFSRRSPDQEGKNVGMCVSRDPL